MRKHHNEIPQYEWIIIGSLFMIVVMKIAYFFRALKETF
jgi:hypothetical protein